MDSDESYHSESDFYYPDEMTKQMTMKKKISVRYVTKKWLQP